MTFATLNGPDPVRRLHDAASDAGPSPQLVVDRDGTVVHMNQHLRILFGLTLRDIGRPLEDLEISYRPFELRSCVERAYLERRPVAEVNGRWTGPDDQVSFLELSVVPLLDGSGTPLGVSIHFSNVSGQRRLEEDVQRVSQELEAALEELRSANEELGTMNAELQSTNEELRTMTTRHSTGATRWASSMPSSSPF